MILNKTADNGLSMMDGKAKIPYEMLLNKKGRARLPDKLMDHLSNEELSDVIWWLPDGTSFAMDSKTVQERFLDIHFRGTKLTSFIRSLNRWGFRRVFFHAMPRNAICFQSPHFKKGQPELLREMKLAATGAAGSARSALSSQGSQAAAASSAAVASSSQVDALFGDDLSSRVAIQQTALLAPHMASLRQPALGALSLRSPAQRTLQANLQLQSRLNTLSEASSTGLSPYDTLGSSLGQTGLSARLGASAATGNLQLPGLPQLRGQDHSRQHALLAMMQREQLLQQLQQSASLSASLPSASLPPAQERPASPSARTHEYIQNVLHTRTAATALLSGVNPLVPAGQRSQERQQLVQGALANRLLFGASLPRVGASESKQDDPPARSAGEESSVASAAEARLAEELARRGR